MPSSRSDDIHIRVKKPEGQAWRVAAKQSDMTLSEWIRAMCNTGAVPAPLPVPPVISGPQLQLPKVK